VGGPGVGGAPDRLSRGGGGVGRAGRPARKGLSRRRRKQARGGSRGGRCGGMRAEPKGERYGAPPVEDGSVGGLAV